MNANTTPPRVACALCDGIGFDSMHMGWPQECAGCSGSGYVEHGAPAANDLGASLARAGDDEAESAADEWAATVIFLAWAAFVVLVVVCVEQWPAVRGFVARWQP